MKPEQLIAIRKRLGLTQAQLGTRIGRTERQVRRWESGEPIPHWVPLLLKSKGETK